MRLEQHVGGLAAVLAANRRRQLLGCMIPERPVGGSATAKPVAHHRRPDATRQRLVQKQGPGGFRSRNEDEEHQQPRSDTPKPPVRTLNATTWYVSLGTGRLLEAQRSRSTSCTELS